MNLYGLSQVINVPTRLSENSSSLIDHILCNTTDKIFQSGSIPIGISDHNIIYCTRKVVKEKFHKHNTVNIRSMKNFDNNLFVEELEKVDWNICTSSCDIDENWDNFRESFTNVIDKCAPKKEIRVKQTTEPWMDSEILELINERDRLLHVFIKSNDKQDFSKFSKVRNLVQRKIKKAKADHISSKIEENKDEPKKVMEPT